MIPAPPNKIVLISDIHGMENSPWMKRYQRILSSEFEVQTHCVLQLAGIDSDLDKMETHSKLVNGGIDKAVNELLIQLPENALLLGFSVGGVVAWKCIANGYKAPIVFCLSSTRLRKESIKPESDFKLVFGEMDEYKPNDEWFVQMQLMPKLLAKEGHDFYLKESFIVQFASQIIWSNGLIQ